MNTDTETYNVFQLARMAEVQSPDSATSPGAEWLASVERDARDLIENHKDSTTGIDVDDYHDEITEYADNAVPVYTHNRWEVFVDLCAYTEDVTEFGEPEDMTAAAGVALYMIAERLIRAIVEAEAESSDDDNDHDDDDDQTELTK